MKFSTICATLITALQANYIPYNYYQGNGNNNDIKSQLTSIFKGLPQQDQNSIRSIASSFGYNIPPTYYHGFYPPLNQWGPNEANTYGGPSSVVSSYYGIDTSSVENFFKSFGQETEKGFKNLFAGLGVKFASYYQSSAQSNAQSNEISERLSKEDRDKIYQEFMKLNEEERKDVLEFIVLIATSLPNNDEDDQDDQNDPRNSFNYYSGHGFRSF